MAVKNSYSLSAPVVVVSVDNFTSIKEKILNLLDFSSQVSSELKENVEVSISRSDWDYNQDGNREWLRQVFPMIQQHILEACQKMGYNSYEISEIWFQQYENNDSHGWHIHAGNFAGVFYVELPEGTPITNFVDPITKKIFVPDAAEGDIVIFPSYLLHKSPVNQSFNRKTIISFNFNIGYPDEFYGLGIEQ